MQNSNTSEDQDLIKAYQNGDQKALNQLISKYYKYIYKVLTYYRKIPVDKAQDYTQDICLRLIESLSGLKVESSLKNFLDRMINNKAIDDYRRRLTKKTDSLFMVVLSGAGNEKLLLDTLVASDDSSVYQDHYLELEKRIKYCLSIIKNKTMQQLVNFWLNGFRGKLIKRKDMAKLLNVTIGYVNGTLERGKTLFRKCIRENYDN